MRHRTHPVVDEMTRTVAQPLVGDCIEHRIHWIRRGMGGIEYCGAHSDPWAPIKGPTKRGKLVVDKGAVDTDIIATNVFHRVAHKTFRIVRRNCDAMALTRSPGNRVTIFGEPTDFNPSYLATLQAATDLASCVRAWNTLNVVGRRVADDGILRPFDAIIPIIGVYGGMRPAGANQFSREITGNRILQMGTEIQKELSAHPRRP